MASEPEEARRHAFAITAATVVAATLVTLFLGYLVKRPCASGAWDGRQYGTLPCYSDIVPLFSKEQLDQGKLPYFGADNEYPVLTGMTMALAGWPAANYSAFFHLTVLVLAGAAVVTAVALYRAVGQRALYFALAPTLLVYGFMNWDLIAVALATLATLAYVRGRDGPAGALLGLGAAAKLYPGLLVVPFAGGRLRDGDRGGAVRVAGLAVIAWALVNAPFALGARDHWLTFFRFNGERSADWDSVWFLLARHLEFQWPVSLLNLLSLGAFAALGWALWNLKSAREPGFPAWTFGLPLLVAFLLTNKVYSPQYGLWLLPWFALALPRPGLFVAFEIADVGVFLTRFRWFATLQGTPGGLPFAAFETFVLIRAAILVACLVAWVRSPAERLAEPAALAGTVR
jgi:uncharacterized membrane protein